MSKSDQTTIYYVVFDNKGRHVSTTGCPTIAEKDVRTSGGNLIVVGADHAFGARQQVAALRTG
jgi:hypothetical protein